MRFSLGRSSLIVSKEQLHSLKQFFEYFDNNTLKTSNSCPKNDSLFTLFYCFLTLYNSKFYYCEKSLCETLGVIIFNIASNYIVLITRLSLIG